MQSVYTYFVHAQGRTAAAFAATQPYVFLLKPPSAVGAPQGAATSSDEFEEPGPNPYFAWDQTSTHGGIDAPPGLRDWLVSPVVRASKFPPFNRVSVGRSRICDVIVPFPSISKVHAHFHVEGLRVLAIADQHSSNGLFLNARRLAPDEVAPVQPGDQIRLGSMEFKLVDAAALHAFLLSFEPR